MILNMLLCAYSKFVKLNLETSKTFSRIRYSYPYMGKDMRYNGTSNLDIDMLDKIKMYNHKLQVLQRLEDNKVSIFDKVDLIENEEIINFFTSAPNITRAGLFDDWDWDFDKIS
jgi:hypothetical protein